MARLGHGLTWLCNEGIMGRGRNVIGFGKVWLACLLGLSVFAASGCASPQVSPSTVPVIHSQYQLEYRLLADFDGVFWNDPDLYPIARPGQEQANAIEQFPAIRSNQAEFQAILEHLSLDSKPDYTDAEQLLIYRQHKLLTLAVQMTPLANGAYRFSLRVGEGQGELIEGTIRADGQYTVEKRQPSFNTHPICLSRGTLIDTPEGPIPVEELARGMMVWTLDESGNRVAAPIAATRRVDTGGPFLMTRITLADDRSLTASGGHPTGEGKPIAAYAEGETLGGSTVVRSELVPCSDGSTYDILPAGATGIYWANGIALRSTIRP